MFAFNFLFWLLGCAILGVGIWIRVDPNFRQYVDSSDAFNYLYTGAYILIVVGVLVMIIGFLGCCGAIRESQCMLATFFVFLFIIFAVLLAAGIWAIIAKDDLKESVTKTLEESVRKYNTDNASKVFMDNVQNNFKCCGSSKGGEDYRHFDLDAPESCGKNQKQSCDDKLFEYFRDNLVIIAGVAIGIGVVMLLGMVFSMMLCCAIREACA